MSVKLVAYEPAPSPVAACTTLVCPPAVCQVTTIFVPCGVTDVMWKTDALLVGLVPAKNSARLFWPSPSGSQVAQDWLLVAAPIPPKYCARHQSVMPSPT